MVFVKPVQTHYLLVCNVWPYGFTPYVVKHANQTASFHNPFHSASNNELLHLLNSQKFPAIPVTLSGNSLRSFYFARDCLHFSAWARLQAAIVTLTVPHSEVSEFRQRFAPVALLPYQYGQNKAFNWLRQLSCSHHLPNSQTARA